MEVVAWGLCDWITTNENITYCFPLKIVYVALILSMYEYIIKFNKNIKSKNNLLIIDLIYHPFSVLLFY